VNLPVIALIGRPNVGKSALFNRIVGGNTAIVSEEAGTTRDRHFARAEWNGQAFWLVDTGGLTDDPSRPMDVEIRKQVIQAIEEADLMLVIVDAKAGPHPLDFAVLELLRTSRKPWILVANMVDQPQSTEFYDMYTLGGGDPVPVSAINGAGSGDLLDAITERIPPSPIEDAESLHVAVIG